MWPSDLFRCHRFFWFVKLPAMFHLLSEAQLPITSLHPTKLATKGTKTESIDETPTTNLTVIGDTFTRPRLRSFVQEHYLCAVDNVRLYTWNVQKSLNLVHPNHVMVGRSSYLNNTMIFVMGQTVGTERVTTAVQAIHVAFAFISISMETTSGKVISS